METLPKSVYVLIQGIIVVCRLRYEDAVENYYVRNINVYIYMCTLALRLTLSCLRTRYGVYIVYFLDEFHIRITSP
jgi:hypothetical protein